MIKIKKEETLEDFSKVILKSLEKHKAYKEMGRIYKKLKNIPKSIEFYLLSGKYLNARKLIRNIYIN